ncbi:Uncharacterized protein BWINRA5_00193 [Bacillus mycoides]|uniref:putative mucin/carbohydrate-binding domain-containing protein n=1 Tax=Bacillus mycoides TaxID=1405 RepID=UPI0008172721|nr:putative mucin/carbohydrate-binding domain-containing protein [Bacillus mycoides]SCA96876.1 Uncharacterized protein BWINRA5_00193 [Bacillus mycoides]
MKKNTILILLIFILSISLTNHPLAAETLNNLGFIKEQQTKNERLIHIDIRGNNVEEYQEAQHMVDRIKKIKSGILDKLVADGTYVKLVNYPITESDEYRDLKGLIPRGWEGQTNAEGKQLTWDDVPGVGSDIGGKPVMARIGFSERGKGHGSINLELHEIAHAIDRVVFLNISHTDLFDVPFSQERQKIFPDKYYENKEEYFAECFTYYYFSESSKQELKDKAPLTYRCIDLLIKTVQGDSNSTEPINELLDGNQFAWSLKGYSDREFAKVDYNKKAEEMKIKLEAGIPHSYFNSTYASIKVQNSSGIVLYNKEIVGNRQQNVGTQTVPVKVGDYIELTHIEGDAQKEKTRATLTNLENNKNETIGKTARYRVTKEGLKKVEKMPETTVLDGNQFGWTLKGYSDREIAKVDYNRETEKMQVKLEAGVPHSYFNNTYASIKVQNSSGSVVYNKEIMGNRKQTAESQTVPVKVGDYIEFTHIEGEAVKEKTRATLTNLENSKQEYIGKKRTYQVTSTGLSKID